MTSRIVESRKWKIKYEENGDPIWIIVAILPDEEEEFELAVMLGVCSAPTKEDALSTVTEYDECEFIDAYNVLSIISRGEMLFDVSNIVDNMNEQE
jgi:hypothetical protein